MNVSSDLSSEFFSLFGFWHFLSCLYNLAHGFGVEWYQGGVCSFV